MSWRYALNQVSADDTLTDVYEFGVFTGQSIVDIHNTLNGNYRKFFGLDSFEGLPEETKEPPAQPCWTKGAFSGLEHFNTNSIDDCVKSTREFITKACDIHDLELIAGFYEDVLDSSSVKKYDMRPAKYVDIDVDIYSSTITVLEFMITNGLIVEGTIIGYDDWGGSPGWQRYEDGESRAHREMSEKYGMICQPLIQIGQQYPHVSKIFRVHKI